MITQKKKIIRYLHKIIRRNHLRYMSSDMNPYQFFTQLSVMQKWPPLFNMAPQRYSMYKWNELYIWQVHDYGIYHQCIEILPHYTKERFYWTIALAAKDQGVLWLNMKAWNYIIVPKYDFTEQQHFQQKTRLYFGWILKCGIRFM